MEPENIKKSLIEENKIITYRKMEPENRYMLFTSREVRIGKNCARRQAWIPPEAVGRGQYSRQRAQFFPIRTDLVLVNNILIFF